MHTYIAIGVVVARVVLVEIDIMIAMVVVVVVLLCNVHVCAYELLCIKACLHVYDTSISLCYIKG